MAPLACRMLFDENNDGDGLPQLNTNSRRRFLPGSEKRSVVSENRFADSQTEMPGFSEAFK